MYLSLVSSAIDVTADRLREPATRALAAIDRVHSAAGLPRIPLDSRRDDPRSRGQYRVKRNSGRALGIGIDPADPVLELLILHEIGHFIDHQALGSPGSWASIREDHLGRWRRAIEETPSIRSLHALLDLDDRELTAATPTSRIDDPRAAICYLLTYNELWARSYAQYVVVTSQDTVLLEQLRAERQTGDVIWDLAQWADDEFAPLPTSIDEVLRQKGWR